VIQPIHKNTLDDISLEDMGTLDGSGRHKVEMSWIKIWMPVGHVASLLLVDGGLSSAGSGFVQSGR